MTCELSVKDSLGHVVNRRVLPLPADSANNSVRVNYEYIDVDAKKKTVLIAGGDSVILLHLRSLELIQEFRGVGAVVVDSVISPLQRHMILWPLGNVIPAKIGCSGSFGKAHVLSSSAKPRDESHTSDSLISFVFIFEMARNTVAGSKGRFAVIEAMEITGHPSVSVEGAAMQLRQMSHQQRCALVFTDCPAFMDVDRRIRKHSKQQKKRSTASGSIVATSFETADGHKRLKLDEIESNEHKNVVPVNAIRRGQRESSSSSVSSKEMVKQILLSRVARLQALATSRKSDVSKKLELLQLMERKVSVLADRLNLGDCGSVSHDPLYGVFRIMRQDMRPAFPSQNMRENGSIMRKKLTRFPVKSPLVELQETKFYVVQHLWKIVVACKVHNHATLPVFGCSLEISLASSDKIVPSLDDLQVLRTSSGHCRMIRPGESIILQCEVEVPPAITSLHRWHNFPGLPSLLLVSCVAHQIDCSRLGKDPMERLAAAIQSDHYRACFEAISGQMPTRRCVFDSALLAMSEVHFLQSSTAAWSPHFNISMLEKSLTHSGFKVGTRIESVSDLFDSGYICFSHIPRVQMLVRCNPSSIFNPVRCFFENIPVNVNFASESNDIASNRSNPHRSLLACITSQCVQLSIDVQKESTVDDGMKSVVIEATLPERCLRRFNNSRELAGTFLCQLFPINENAAIEYIDNLESDSWDRIRLAIVLLWQELSCFAVLCRKQRGESSMLPLAPSESNDRRRICVQGGIHVSVEDAVHWFKAQENVDLAISQL